MGDFSRDTFQLTNALHQVLSGQAVASPRHYVGIRLQQGVPLLDSDWNELEDLRRLELQTLVKMFIGTGVPAGNDGFRISSSGDANNFSIHPGVILAEGMLIINLALTTYLAQPEQTGLAPLTTPGGIVDRTDIVFLDVWHEEVAADGGANPDGRLKNGLVGIETAVRIQRRWQVRVAEGASDLSGVAAAPGHVLLPLALLRRRPATPIISDAMVVNRRVTGLTISNNFKAPLDVSRGLETVDSTRFAQMMHNLRIGLFQRLTQDELPHASASPQQESFLLIAIQDLMNTARAGETQALSLNVSERDALALLEDLYQAQQDWLTALDALGNFGGVAQPFIDQYATFLDGQPGTLITGLKPALDASDVIGAVVAQEALNTFLSNPVDTLPEGTVVVAYKLVTPFTPIAAGTTFLFSFDVTAQFTSPQADETFSVDVNLDADFGTASPAHTQLTFPAGAPTTQTVSIIVDPSGVAATGELAVVAKATRNAAVKSTQPAQHLTRGSNPPPPDFFFYAGPQLNAAKQLPIAQAQILATGRDVIFRLKNGSATDSRTFVVSGHVEIGGGGSTAGWSPLADTALPEISLGPNTETSVAFHINGPKPPGNPAPPIGTVGTVVVSAVLTKINGVAAGPQTPVTVPIAFVIV